MINIPTFEDFVFETIRAEEAHRDENAIQTVIDGKRDLGFIAIKASTMKADTFWELVKKHGLKTMEVPGNEYEAYIYYKPSAERKAIELKKIAVKYGGFLAHNATKAESIRIGQLLGYDKKDIDWYINKNYR
jgi:hypothetical protein